MTIAEAKEEFIYNDVISDPFIEEYCALSEQERATKIRYLENLVSFTPVKKKPFNFNRSAERARKKEIEQSIRYNKSVYPEQEAAYKLGLLYSDIPCEILQFKKSVYFLSLSGRKPETHFLLGRIYYNKKQTPQNIVKAIDFYENAGEMGIKQGYVNAIALLRKYDIANKHIRIEDIYTQYKIINK